MVSYNKFIQVIDLSTHSQTIHVLARLSSLSIQWFCHVSRWSIIWSPRIAPTEHSKLQPCNRNGMYHMKIVRNFLSRNTNITSEYADGAHEKEFFSSPPKLGAMEVSATDSERDRERQKKTERGKEREWARERWREGASQRAILILFSSSRTEVSRTIMALRLWSHLFWNQVATAEETCAHGCAWVHV